MLNISQCKGFVAPFLTVWAIFLTVVAYLHDQGRSLICTCGKVYLWVGDVWSSHNSQHIADPYTFSHVQHGLIFYWLLRRLFPKVTEAWVFVGVILLESSWEMLENSAYMIERYRTNTASLGYTGDSILNAVADILFCWLGAVIARRIGMKATIALYICIELGMLLTIRDSLILNVITLVMPLPGLVEWQRGSHFPSAIF